MVGIGRAITGVPVAAPGARDFLHVAGLQPPVDATTLGEDSRHKSTNARMQNVWVGSALILKQDVAELVLAKRNKNLTASS